MPTTPYLLCDKCRTALPDALFNTPEPIGCPGCNAPLLARVFPAFFREPSGGARAAESIGSDEDASCFYHPRKKAVVPCGQCGRFLCALCDFEFEGRHFCPGCVEAGRNASGALALQTGGLLQRRTLHDKVALALAAAPMMFFVITVLTAPATLFMVIRYWNEPPSRPVPAGRGRLIFAGLLALAQLVGWACVAYFYWFHSSAFRR